MPLFGPIGPAVDAGGLYGVDFAGLNDAFGSSLPYPPFASYNYLFPPLRPATTAGASTAPAAAAATSAAPAPAPAPPAMQSVGSFATRRTQLFGPLSGIGI